MGKTNKSDFDHTESKPSLETKLELSIVIPAYNERERLPPYLEEIRPYMDEKYADLYEIIIVDDGSSDRLHWNRQSLKWWANRLR